MIDRRFFDAGRAYKLTRLLVVIVTLFTLFFGTLGFINFNKNQMFYLDPFYDCMKQDYGNMETCGYMLDIMSESRQEIDNY